MDIVPLLLSMCRNKTLICWIHFWLAGVIWLCIGDWVLEFPAFTTASHQGADQDVLASLYVTYLDVQEQLKKTADRKMTAIQVQGLMHSH